MFITGYESSERQRLIREQVERTNALFERLWDEATGYSRLRAEYGPHGTWEPADVRARLDAEYGPRAS